MRTFNGYMEYRYVCDTCGAEFDNNDKVEEGDICPECKEGKIDDYSQRISAEEHKERYMDMKADEYCDNGGKKMSIPISVITFLLLMQVYLLLKLMGVVK